MRRTSCKIGTQFCRTECSAGTLTGKRYVNHVLPIRSGRHCWALHAHAPCRPSAVQEPGRQLARERAACAACEECCNIITHCSSAVQLVELFGSTRDAWMKDNLGDWLAANEIYQGVPAIVQHLRSQGPFFIVTTKQVRCRKGSLALANVVLLLSALHIAPRHLRTMRSCPFALRRR